MKKTNVRVMAEIAICVALSTVLGLFTIFKMPQGGSISLEMLPILLIAFRRGGVVGIITGLVYGLIDMFIGGYYGPWSLLLDYLLAFGFVGVAGFFKKNVPGIAIGSCVGIVLRFICSLLSGAWLFAEYAPAGQNPWLYSSIYNATYLIPELIISIVVIVVIYLKAKKLFSVQ